MKLSPSHFLPAINQHIGRCPACMQTSFLSAAISWLIVIGLLHTDLSSGLTTASWIIAAGLSLLWVLHLITYTARIITALWSEYAPINSGLHNPTGPKHSRRELVMLLISGAGLAISAAIWLPIPARARGNPCGKGYCPDSAPNCCSRSRGKCCNGNWACTKTGSCHARHSDARRKCGRSGIVWACS